MELEVKIRKKLGGFRMDMEFEAKAGRTGILGASGCGKSMTLKAIAGIVTPDEGRIVLNGRVLFDAERKINIPPQERNAGYLFQNYALFPNMSVEQNIAAGLRGRDAGGRTAREKRVAEMIRMFGLTGLEKLLPRSLSGGQQQRVALARILSYKPEVILLDEPFSALDAYLKDRLQEELLEYLAEYDGLILMVSHSRDEIYRFADELIIMGRGQVEVQGGVREVFRDPHTKAAAILTGCKNFSAAERLSDHALLARDWGIELHTEKVLPQHFNCIGYRAHFLEPVYGARKENCIAFRLHGQRDLPFEKNFYIRPEKDGYAREHVITWFVQRGGWAALEERGLPDYLQLKEDGILFLQDGTGENE